MKDLYCKKCDSEFRVDEDLVKNKESFKCPFCGYKVQIQKLVRPHSPENYLALYKSGKSISEIASILSVKEMTVRNNLLYLYERGDIESIDFITVSAENEAVIRGVIETVGMQFLKTIKVNCPEDISYDDIAVVVSMVKRERNSDIATA